MNSENSESSEFSNQVSDRFLELVLLYFDGELSAAELEQLNRDLRESAACREAFAAHCFRTQMIREVGEPERLAEIRPGQDMDGVISHLRLAKRSRRTFASRFGSWRHVASAAALLLLAGMLWMSGVFHPGKTRPEEPIATLVQAIDLTWHEGDPVLEKGARIGSRLLRLESGLAKFRFRQGTSVTLEGPAEFEIVDHGLARLLSGRLAATVPPEAIGFKINTPAMRVVDLGTAFGIRVDGTGGTEVSVFEGEVEVDVRENRSPNRAGKRVTEGLAVWADVGGTEISEICFDVDQFARTWPVNAGVLRTMGMVRFAPPGPLQSLLEYEDDDHLVILPERRRFTLRKVIQVNITRPGEYRQRGKGRRAKLQKGMRVRSYLVQFNPLDVNRRGIRRLVGVATFERPIVGIITDARLLAETDRILGGHRERLVAAARGVEGGGDVVTLNDDYRTLCLDLEVRGPGLDQIRVLVDESD